MKRFHLITLSIAIIVLIGTLTLAGIALNLAAKSTVFPPSTEKCPNGCIEELDASGNINCVCKTNNADITDKNTCEEVTDTTNNDNTGTWIPFQDKNDATYGCSISTIDTQTLCTSTNGSWTKTENAVDEVKAKGYCINKSTTIGTVNVTESDCDTKTSVWFKTENAVPAEAEKGDCSISGHTTESDCIAAFHTWTETDAASDEIDAHCNVTFESKDKDNCEKKAWATKHGLYWDGIDNYTAC